MNIFDRFRRKIPSDPPELKKVVSAAQRCLNNTEGEFFIDHLIEYFELDNLSGCLPIDESNYKNGTQDVIKYILSLITYEE